MIELKISKGEYLTHKDLEKFLNSYKKFLNDYLNKENLFEYEWEEFWIFHNNYIKQQITKYNKIELIVEDISKGDFSGSYELLESICFTGEDLGNWRDKNDIVKSKIRHTLGLTENTIFARKCTIKEVDFKTSKIFLNEKSNEQ